jgi:hypothetical protein
MASERSLILRERLSGGPQSHQFCRCIASANRVSRRPVPFEKMSTHPHSRDPNPIAPFLDPGSVNE